MIYFSFLQVFKWSKLVVLLNHLHFEWHLSPKQYSNGLTHHVTKNIRIPFIKAKSSLKCLKRPVFKPPQYVAQIPEAVEAVPIEVIDPPVVFLDSLRVR